MNDHALSQPPTTPGVAPLRGVSDRLCLGLARLFLTGPLAKLGFRHGPAARRFGSHEAYVSDRRGHVESYRALFNEFCSFAGKTVLDLGCSTGYLLAEFLKHEDFEAIGAEIDGEKLALCRSSYGDRIAFVRSAASRIPLPDEGVDIIYTVDTFEHLARPRDILLEAHRILRPGGFMLIHFQPWLGPCGSHLEDILPFPWPNAFFSMDTLLRVAAHLYESLDYTPASYWFEPRTGARRDNPYLDHGRWDEFLNRMTVRRFQRLLAGLPFTVVHLQPLGFGGSRYRLGRILRPLARVPLLNELFTSAVFCVLRKPDCESAPGPAAAGSLEGSWACARTASGC